jgi:CheY-like chemotaxis protein
LDKIEQTTRRAADLTRQMLAYSGRGVFIKAPLALDEAVREMVNLLKVSISKKVELRFEFEESLAAIEGDTAQIQQVIMNLVTNASEAIGDVEGEILLSLRSVELDGAQVAAVHPATPVEPGRYLALGVRDTGIGMSAQTMARMFDPFFTTKFSGRGLGMSAMLGILKAHQAGILIKSELGVGTEFLVFFPESAFPVLHQEPAVSSSVPRGRVTLLVVDDEPSILEATTRMLEHLDFQVLQARDGQEAVEAYFSHPAPIQAVLMDLTMPRMDGLEAASEILRRNPQARLILTSGFSPSATMDLKHMGLAGFLQKPFGRTQLLEALKPVLGEDI